MTAVLGSSMSSNPFGASVSICMPDLDALRGMSLQGNDPLGPRELQKIKERQQAEQKEQ